jgi:hypothetical protein
MTLITNVQCDLCGNTQTLPDERYEYTFLHLERGGFPYEDKILFGEMGRPRHLCNKCAEQVFHFIANEKIKILNPPANNDVKKPQSYKDDKYSF